jgi:hypothetical protein
VFEKNKMIEQMKIKFEESLKETVNELTEKSALLKIKLEESKKIKQKYQKA